MLSASTVIVEDFTQLKNFLDSKETITIYGWVDNIRDHGGLTFWDIRRDDTLIQVVFINEVISKLPKVHYESVVKIHGHIRTREEININPKEFNGTIELVAKNTEVISLSKVLPFDINNCENIKEDMLQEYRYLVLRKGITRTLVKKRAEFFSFLRTFMEKHDFLEVNTPILTASSPEGARDFLIPSRLHTGKFYALPQSPQIFKQLLMLSGFNRYYQLAPCFRDEDARIDRSPCDFYQLDFELAFPNQEQILNILQDLIISCYEKFGTKPLYTKEFPSFTHKEAIENYGTDKPDLRNKVTIHDVTEFFSKNEFKIFRERISQGDIVKAFVVPEPKNRGFFDKILVEWEKKTGKKLAYVCREKDEWNGPIAKFMDQSMMFGSNGMVFMCDSPKEIRKNLHNLHKTIAESGGFLDNDNDYYCFIVDFPMFEYDPSKESWDFSHNPFAMPKEYSDKMTMDQIIAQQYDLVGNGYEVASGAIRNHDINLFRTIANRIGYNEEYLQEAFPALLKGFQYGVPPHGGAAPGLERLMMILFNRHKIRDVIPFPMLQNGRDLMMNAPSSIGEKHLKELKIAIIDSIE